MGYALQIDLQDAQPLASNSGWGDFIRWVESLPASGFRTLTNLCDEGWSGDIPTLRKQLDKALADHAPKADVRTTAEGLSALLVGAEDAEVVSVTDGLGPP